RIESKSGLTPVLGSTAATLATELRKDPNSALFTLGAGDIWKLAGEVLEELGRTAASGKAR
ncbi:MAG: hypothetical protein RBT63_06685, partial [Bdellovibrionales bacterium]|nr:hypothetical protein [Bdellovibrionales bacterium]